MTYEFEIQIKAKSLSDRLAGQVIAAQCDDALLCKTSGRVYLKFERKGRSRDATVSKAARQLSASGIPLIISPKYLADR